MSSYALWRRKTRARWAALILVLWCGAAAQTIPPDYKAYFDAEQAQKAGQHQEALRRLNAVWQAKPVSPLAGKAAVIAARSWLALQKPQEGIIILRRNDATLPQPEGNLLLGQLAEASGDQPAAAGWYQQVFYRFPLSKESAEAESALERLRTALGVNFPPPMPQEALDRAEALRKSGQAAKARRELLAAASFFGGRERDLAMVRAYHGDYHGLAALRATDPEADAERIYLMHAAARRNSMEAEAEAALKELESKYPKSSWTREALTSWGNHFLLRNDAEAYLPFFRRCYERFADDPQAAYCHWKVAWNAWMRRAQNARALMQEHAERFPQSEKASAALYFSGRYADVIARWPMSYYAVLARRKVKAAPPPARPDPLVFTPTATTKLRIARAKQLEKANLPEWADFELKYAAQEQPYAAAIELAELSTSRGSYAQGLRYIKSLAKGYLAMPTEAAPERFWKLAFPLPYRNTVVANSRSAGLDAYLIAALMRQESEFDPKVISRARAYGLTQVLPSTGRQLSRQLGIRNFRSSMLFEPEINIRLGTEYLKRLLNAHGGREEETLAAYNAGKSRVDKWSTWFDYREPAEFIESIPFTETRNYVQIVLRNADLYRRLYGSGD